MKTLIILMTLLLTSQLCFSKDKLIAGLFNIIPYAYEENQQIIGITPEIIEGIQKESGVEIQMLFLPYKRMLKYLKSGKIDFAIFFLSYYSASFSDNLIPLYNLETIAIGKKGLTISNYHDLYKLRLATARGVNYNTVIDRDKELLQIHYVKDYENAIRMLNKGHVDAIIAPKRILSFQLKKFGMKISDLGEPYLIITNTAWIQFSNKSSKKSYKKVLAKSAQNLLDKGVILEIMNKYYSK